MLVAFAALGGSASSEGEFAWLLVSFLAWQMFHYQRQNLGLTAIAARVTHSRSLNTAERRAITACRLAAIAGLLARPERLQRHVDPGVRWLLPVAAFAYVSVTTIGVLQAVRRTRDGEDVSAVALVTSCLFFTPVFLFASPYAAAAGLTVAHGLQYLVLLGRVGVARQRTQLYAGATQPGAALGGGALLHQASHLHGAAAPISRVLFGAYIGVVMAHFVIDAGLWRLRAPRAARFVSTYLPELVAVD